MPKLVVIFLVILIFLFSSCNNNDSESNEINISVSIPPFADIVKQIVGDRANVNTLIPPGTNAHSFEPVPKALKQVLKSDIYFKVGQTFQLENILLNKIESSITDIIDCTSGIQLINNNPHYWLSPSNVKIISQNMLNILVESYPQHKNYFINNRNKFLTQLDSIDAIISNQLVTKKEKIIFVYHPAWTYLADHYGLREITIELDGKPPKAQDIQKIIEFAKEKEISCIFFDPHFDESSVTTIASSLNLDVDSFNPLPSNYLLNLADIGKKLNKYLK